MTKDPVKRRAQNFRYYVKNTQKYRDRNTARMVANRELVYQYLLKHPCACGESDPVALDFDHDDPKIKTRTIAELINRGAATETIMAEIDKCTVRCSNCHRKRHAAERGWYRHQAA